VTRLDSALDHPVVLVSAPAGYGKSTLVAHWLSAQSYLASVWLSLDADDNDPARFFAHLITGMSPYIPESSDTLLNLLAQSVPLDVTVASLVNALIVLDDPLVIVLDDYHVINQRILHNAIQQLIDRLPPQLHLMLLTRADPPLTLARLRARNALLEIRVSDLRFDTDEAGRFLTLMTGKQLDGGQLAQIVNKSEGWAAALQLAALTLQRQADVNAFVESLSGAQRHIVDYLVDEVLAHLPERAQQFLLQTSVLKRMCGTLCDALTGRDDSQEMLEYLDRMNLFLVPLDDERRWYRYHHLFAQFLQNRLGADAARRQHQKAANWYAANDAAETAIDHAFSGNNFEYAGSMVEQVFRPLFSQGHFSTLLGYYERFSADHFRRHPDWQLSYSATLLGVVKIDAARTHLLAATANLAEAPAEKRVEWYGWSAAIRAWIASVERQVEDTLHWSAIALEHLPQEDIFTRATVLWTRGFITDEVLDQPLAALETFHHALELARRANHMTLESNLVHRIGALLRTLGRLVEAESMFLQTIDRFPKNAAARLPLAALIDGLALTLFEQSRIEEANALFTPELITLIDGCGVPMIQIPSLLTRAMLASAEEDFDRALDLTNTAMQISGSINDTASRRGIEAYRAAILLAKQQPREAYTWAARYEAEMHPEARFMERQYVFDTLMWTGVLLHQGRYGELFDVLAPMIDKAHAAGRITHEIKLRIMQSLAHHASGDLRAGCAALQAILNQPLPLPYLRVYLNHKHMGIAALLRDYQRETNPSGDEAAFIADILREMDDRPSTSAPIIGIDIELLTEREMEILHLIELGLTNKAIAERLVISVATVKKHISNIFLKLDAQNRTQALSRAREYNLLQ
jgi:LuxR family maltose regulon positive regulatory protein